MENIIKNIRKPKCLTALIALLCFVSGWGQFNSTVNPDACRNTNPVTIVSAKFMHANNGNNRPFRKPSIFNLQNTRMRNNKQQIFLEFHFNNPQHNKDSEQVVVVTMNLPNWLEPMVNSNNKTPQGYNVTPWWHLPGPGQTSRNQTPRPDPNWPRFTRDGDENRFNRGEYRIGALKHNINNNYDGTHNNGGNGTAIMFDIKEGTYVKNYQIDAYVGTFTHYNEIRRGSPSTGFTYTYDPAYCNRHRDKGVQPYEAPFYTIDLIRPTFPTAPANQDLKVNEPLEIQLSAKDTDQSGATIPQAYKTNAPTNPRDIRLQHMEDGVFTSVVSVKKVITLAGGRTREEELNRLPNGLYIDQITQKIMGTPTEQGVFKISLITTDAAGNGQEQGSGTPTNWTPTPVTFTLGITPRMGLVNPSLRMRVSQ